MTRGSNQRGAKPGKKKRLAAKAAQAANATGPWATFKITKRKMQPIALTTTNPQPSTSAATQVSSRKRKLNPTPAYLQKVSTSDMPTQVETLI